MPRLGTLRAWTERTIAKLAEVTPEDIARARAAWKEDTKRDAAKLLDAEAHPTRE